VIEYFAAFICWMLRLFCIGSVTKQDYAPRVLRFYFRFRDHRMSEHLGLTSILLKSPPLRYRTPTTGGIEDASGGRGTKKN